MEMESDQMQPRPRGLPLRVTPLLAALTLLGCGSAGLRVKYSNARFVNAVAGVANTSGAATGPAVDFTSRDNLTALNIPFGGASSYLRTPQGSAVITSAEHGTQTAAVPPTELVLEQDKVHTVLAVGTVGGTGLLAPQLIRLTDGIPSSIPADKAALRLVHASPNTLPVDLYQGAGTSTPAPLLGVTNVSYGNASGYVLVPVGAVTLEVHDTGTGLKVDTPTLARGVALSAGKAYTALVTGVKNATPPQEPFDARLILDN